MLHDVISKCSGLLSFVAHINKTKQFSWVFLFIREIIALYQECLSSYFHFGCLTKLPCMDQSKILGLVEISFCKDDKIVVWHRKSYETYKYHLVRSLCPCKKRRSCCREGRKSCFASSSLPELICEQSAWGTDLGLEFVSRGWDQDLKENICKSLGWDVTPIRPCSFYSWVILLVNFMLDWSLHHLKSLSDDSYTVVKRKAFWLPLPKWMVILTVLCSTLLFLLVVAG